MATSTGNPNLAAFRRFLYLGDECDSLLQSTSYPFNEERAQLIQDVVNAGLAEEALKEIISAYQNNKYLGIETLVYALVAIGHATDASAHCKAFEMARTVCTSAMAVLTFTHIYRETSKPAKGWGRGHRNFLRKWYNGKEAKDLAVEVSKVKKWHKWTHKDVLCMAHVKAENPATAAVLKYLVRGLEAAQKDCTEPDAEPVLSYLKATYELSHTTDPELAARLIEIHDLCLEHVPSKILKTKEVAQCLISRVPLLSLLDLLPRFNRAGLLKLNSPAYNALLDRLSSEDSLTDITVGPLESFLAIRKWQISNRISPGKSLMRQNTPALEDALQNLHLASFKTVKPIEKKFLVALDINLSMNHSKCTGCNALTPSHVSDIILLALMKADISSVTTVAFSQEEIVPVELNHKMNLADVVEHLNEIQPGPACLSAPINWALSKKMPFNTFLVFTDRLTSTQDADLAAVMKEYKEILNLPNTRYIICTLCDKNSSFPHEDPSFLNLVGFNVKLLKIIQDFSCGVF